MHPKRLVGAPSNRTHTLIGILVVTLSTLSCGGTETESALVIGGIPDQDFTILEERFGGMAALIASELHVDARYAPTSNYAALVTAFEHGDVLLGWFGGLTGVQARRAVPGARAIAHRPADAAFRSVFIIRDEIEAHDLADLPGRSFTFGSESSTSGHLMPRHFLSEAGILPEKDFGAVNYSGSHDATWQLVEDGVWDAGVLNLTVWRRAVREGQVDTTAVRVLEISPPYYDYHWVAHPDLDARFGEGTIERLTEFLVDLGQTPDAREILDLFQTSGFVTTRNENYETLEVVADRLGLLGER